MSSLPLPDDRAWLLGRQSRSTADFYTVWRGIRRMTYRKNFETPLYNQSKHLEFHCDTGWGCTIRSAQMLLLVALKRHHGLDASSPTNPDGPYRRSQLFDCCPRTRSSASCIQVEPTSNSSSRSRRRAMHMLVTGQLWTRRIC